jgi:hypothetical protein
MAAKSKKAVQQPEVVRNQDFATIYSNHVGIMTSQYDFQIVFAHVQPSSVRGKIIVERALVSMTPGNAKQLTDC